MRNLYLHYLATGETQDPLTELLEKHVDIGRKSKEWRREYMLMQEYAERERAEGRAEGRTEGMYIFIEDKLEDGVAPDIIKEKLMRRFSLSETEAKKAIDECRAVTS